MSNVRICLICGQEKAKSIVVAGRAAEVARPAAGKELVADVATPGPALPRLTAAVLAPMAARILSRE